MAVIKPWSARLVLIVLVFGGGFPSLRAQSPELTSVKAWRGHFRATGHQSAADLPDFITRLGKFELGYHASFTAEVYLDEFDDMPPTWSGRAISSDLTSSYDATFTNGDVIKEGRFHASGAPKREPGDHGPRLIFHVGKGWELHFDNVRLAATVTAKTTFPKNGYTATDSGESMAYAPYTTSPRGVDLPYPTKNLILRGHIQFTLDEVTSSALLPVTYPVTFEVEVYLEPASLQELQLEIDPGADYEAWMPSTNVGAEAGKPLTVKATLSAKDGSKPMARVESFEWKLVDTSREPGVAMNYPVDAKDHNYDLKLEAQGGHVQVSEDGQNVQRAVPADGLTDTVEVKPYDWGAWSTLQVTAKLSDGREVIGKLKGAGAPDLRLPKRTANSHIADYWKEQNGAKGGDAADEDNNPEGDGSKGDGLTLYEEYRGFYVNWQHLTTDPKKKDLFVYVKSFGSAAAGVQLFANLSQLDVHDKLAAVEFPASRVINANHDGGAHVVDQHGLLVQVVPGQEGYAAARGGPGTPKSITSIDLPADWGKAPLSYIAASVAHEMGHAVNLYHHGDTDIREGTWQLKNTEIFEEGVAVRIMDEREVDITSRVIRALEKAEGQQQEVYIGKIRGEHSGADSCIMRYDCAFTYTNLKRTIYRVTNFKEKAGFNLCATTEGTGVNDPDHTPSTRYGPAAQNRGDCLHQILVNDAVPAPSRR